MALLDVSPLIPSLSDLLGHLDAADTPRALLRALQRNPLLTEVSHSAFFLCDLRQAYDVEHEASVRQVILLDHHLQSFISPTLVTPFPLWVQEPASPLFLNQIQPTEPPLAAPAAAYLQPMAGRSGWVWTLRQHGRLLGWWWVAGLSKTGFDRAMFDAVAVALSQALYRQHLETENQHLKALAALNRELYQPHTLDELVTLLAEAHHIFQAAAGLVYLVQPDGQTHLHYTGHHAPPSAFLSALLTQVQQQPTRLQAHTAAHPGWIALAELFPNFPLQATISIPLHLPDVRWQGVVLYAYLDQQYFDEALHDLVEVLVVQIHQAFVTTTAMTEARRAAETATLLLNSGKALAAALDVDDVFQALLHTALAVGAQRAIIARHVAFDDNGWPCRSCVVAVTNQQKPDSIELLDAEMDLADWPALQTAIANRTVLPLHARQADLSDAEAAYFAETGTATLLFLPLLLKDRPLAYALLEFQTRQHFPAETLALYRTLVEQTNVALGNTAAAAQTRQRARQIQTGAEIAKVASSTLDRPTLIQKAVELIYSGFDFDYVGLFLLDERGRWAILQQGDGEAGRRQLAAEPRLPVDGKSLVGEAIRQRRGRIATSGDRHLGSGGRASGRQAQTELALPLIYQDAVVGALRIQSINPDAFNEEDVQTLQMMADQLANAIQNSRLYELARKSAREFEVLLDVNREISARTDLHDLLQAIIGRATQLVHGDQGTIFLREADGTLVPRAQVGGSGAILKVRVKPGQGVTGQVALERRSIRHTVTDPSTVPRIPGTAAVSETLVGVPIQAEVDIGSDSLIGVLLLRRYDLTRPFTDSDVQLLEVMSLQAAIAVRNANLLETTTSARQQTENLYQFVQDISAADTDIQVVELALRHIPHASYDRAMIALYQFDGAGSTGSLVWVARWEQARQSAAALAQPYPPAEIPMLAQVPTDQPWIVMDVPADVTLDADSRQTLLAQGFKSLVVMPIQAAHRRLGWLFCGNTEQQSEFAAAAIRPLPALVDQVGLTLDRLQKTHSLLEAGEQYLAMVDNIPGVVYRSRADQRRTFVFVSDEILDLTGYSAEAFAQGEINLAALIHPQDQDRIASEIRRQLQDNHAYDLSYRLLNRQSQVRYVSERGRAVLDRVGAVTYLDGVLFDVTDQEELRQAVQRRASQFEAVARVGQIASGILDIDVLLHEVVNLISYNFDFYHAALFLLDETRQWAVLRAAAGPLHGDPAVDGYRVPGDEGSVVGWAIYHAQPRLVENLTTAPEVGTVRLTQTRSEVALPLVARGRVIGALDVHSSEVRAFANDEVTTLSLMAAQLANAIENLRLFSTTEHNLYQAQLLHRTTRALMSAEDETLLFGIFLQTLQQLDFDEVALALRQADAADETYRLRQTWNRQGEGFWQTGALLPLRACVNFQAADIDSAFVVEPSPGDQRLTGAFRQQLLRAGIHSMAFVPILIQDQLEGLVMVSYQQAEQRIKPDTLSPLENLVQQLALTWQNLRLLASLERQLRRERIIREVTARIYAANGIDNILQTTVTELNRALNLPYSAVRLDLQRPGPARSSQDEPRGDQS